MREFHLPIFTFSSLQRREKRFVQKVGLQETPEKIHAMLEGELAELKEAQTVEERMCEVADLALLLTRMAELDGYSLKNAVNGKVRRNQAKYNPRALRRLQTDWGFTPDESMAFAKARWDRGRDEGYFKRYARTDKGVHS